MVKLLSLATLWLSLALSGCAVHDPLVQQPVRLDGVSNGHVAITTSSPEAQDWFDQGLTLMWGFNHDEAVRSFHAATLADPDCTMAWWGLAMAHGVDLNDGRMTDLDRRRCQDAARRAVETSADKPSWEQALAAAVLVRYGERASDRRELDEAYAVAIAEVAANHPALAEVHALHAEGLMALSPWNYWGDDDQLKERPAEAAAALDRALALDADHAGALHLMVHLYEQGDAAQAEAAADRLTDLVPGSGHLLHMPSHILVHVGRYADAADVNEAAIAADAAYFDAVADPGNYFGYYAHNVHMLAFAAMMEGREAVAIAAAEQLERDVTDDDIREDPGWLDGLMATKLHVLVRFGHWGAILREPEPASFRLFSVANWHYARGVAFSALGRTAEARAELKRFERAADRVPEDWYAGSNPSTQIVELARHMLHAELLWREGDAEAAFEQMRQGIEVEDGMRYGEPPGWMQPVRHAYGALLMADGKPQQAEEVYRADLERNPGNGWSLLGLKLALEAQGQDAAAAEAAEELAVAWARADVDPGSSCFCEPGTPEV